MVHLLWLFRNDGSWLRGGLTVVGRLVTVNDSWLVLLRVRLILSGAGWQRVIVQVVTRGCIGRESAPFTVRSLFKFLRCLCHTLASTLFIAVDLHHVDTCEVLLHLFSILDTFTVDHVVDVLDFVRAHTCNILLRCRVAQDRLINRGELVVLVSSCRYQSLLP